MPRIGGRSHATGRRRRQNRGPWSAHRRYWRRRRQIHIWHAISLPRAQNAKDVNFQLIPAYYHFLNVRHFIVSKTSHLCHLLDRLCGVMHYSSCATSTTRSSCFGFMAPNDSYKSVNSLMVFRGGNLGNCNGFSINLAVFYILVNRHLNGKHVDIWIFI